MNELKTVLMEHHKEELADHETYLQLAQKAYEQGFHCAAGILEDIAHDEETHAESLQHILEKEVW